jgi:hypothetical protein
VYRLLRYGWPARNRRAAGTPQGLYPVAGDVAGFRVRAVGQGARPPFGTSTSRSSSVSVLPWAKCCMVMVLLSSNCVMVVFFYTFLSYLDFVASPKAAWLLVCLLPLRSPPSLSRPL